MTDISLAPVNEVKLVPKQLKSSKKSNKNKKSKGNKKLIDISNKIALEFQIEDFEQETESFFPQIYKEENKISINNVNILDQSHLRFLINPNSEIINRYTSYKQKNFKNISWKDIELIYFYSSDNYNCPICLESKLCCPVMSKCGHVFCYPCIVSMYNYYSNYNTDENENNALICPLCKEKIEVNSDLNDCFKICQKFESKNYNIDNKIKFNLIMKDKNSQTLYNLIYDPMLTNWENNFRYKMRDIPETDIKEFNFSRIFLANEQIMKKILNKYKEDLNNLKKEFSSTNDELKKLSINQCINKIDALIENCKYEKSQMKKVNSDEKKFIKSYSKDINKKFSFNNNDDSKLDIDYKQYNLFYQEENGDIYYLEPLIMDILLSEYGDYNSLPTEIEGNILDISMFQVTGELKSKYKYLNHLRIGSIIYFVEIDINDLISSNTKKKFSEKLYERKRMRNLLKNQEKNYELFLTKKNSKISEEEKESDSTFYDSKKNLEKNLCPLIFINDEECEKKENDINNETNDINENKKENKLTLLFEEKEKEEKKVKEKGKNNLNNKNIKKEKGGKNKKNKNICGKKGKKSIKDEVFNSETSENFSESEY